MSPDWSSAPEAVPYADLTNPQSLNLYSYEGNNPLARADKNGHCWPLCTILAGAAIGAVTSGAIEAGAEYFSTGHVNWNKVGNAALGGAVTGAIIGAAGPEAGLGAKALIGSIGAVVGGGVERGVNGEKVGNVKAIAVDAVAGAVSPKVDAIAEKTFATEAVAKTVPKVIDATTDATRRLSDSGSEKSRHQTEQSRPPQHVQQTHAGACSASGKPSC